MKVREQEKLDKFILRQIVRKTAMELGEIADSPRGLTSRDLTSALAITSHLIDRLLPAFEAAFPYRKPTLAELRSKFIVEPRKTPSPKLASTAKR